LMRETGKPIINVAVNEREGAASSALRRLRLFTAASPERAVRVAACLADHASRRGPGKPR